MPDIALYVASESSVYLTMLEWVALIERTLAPTYKVADCLSTTFSLFGPIFVSRSSKQHTTSSGRREWSLSRVCMYLAMFSLIVARRELRFSRSLTVSFSVLLISDQILRPNEPHLAIDEPSKGVPMKIAPTVLAFNLPAASSTPCGFESALATTRPPRLWAT